MTCDGVGAGDNGVIVMTMVGFDGRIGDDGDGFDDTGNNDGAWWKVDTVVIGRSVKIKR